MTTKNEYYTLPDNTDQSISRMLIWLAGFFIGLIFILALVVINAQKIAASIPFSAEKRFIRPYEAAIKKWYVGEEDAGNDIIDNYLQNLVDDLSKVLNVPEDYEIHVHFVDLDIINAFATLGGHVFVFRGLVDEMPDENSLSMVLAHEVAHIKHRDPIAAMGRGFALQLLYGFVTNDYSGTADIASLTGEIGMSFFSREQETQADLVALTAMNEQFGHVTGFDVFFSKMLEFNENVDEPEVPEWLSTHPDLEKRIQYLREQVEREGFSEGNTHSIPSEVLEIINPTL